MSWYDDITDNDDGGHGRVETLLANLLREGGSLPLDEQQFGHSHAVISVPGKDNDYQRKAATLEAKDNRVEFDFADGVAQENGRDVATFERIDDLGRIYDESSTWLRSLSVWVDQPVSVSFDGGANTVAIPAGEWVAFNDVKYQSVFVSPTEYTRIRMAASPRSSAPVTSEAKTPMERQVPSGNYIEQNSTANTNYTTVPWVSDESDREKSLLSTYQETLDVSEYDGATVVVQNSATSNDNMDVKLSSIGMGFQYTLGEQTGLAPGDTAKFILDESHRMIQADYKSVGGLSVDVMGAVISL